MHKFWNTIEGLPTLATVIGQWQLSLGAEFELCKNAFMQKSDTEATWVPCPECGHALEVVKYNGEITGVSDDEDHSCWEVDLSPEELEVWAWSWPKAGRTLAKAFGCAAKLMDLEMVNTWQVAEIGGSRLPIILTIQLSREDFQSAVLELVVRNREGFVLLSPTGLFYDARIQELLSHGKAGFFDLASTVTLQPNGVLHTRKTGGELFSRYLPEEKEPASEKEAAGVFALMKTLDASDQRRKAPTSMVFRLYCQEGLSRAEVAKRCGCVEALVTLRLKEIEAKLGRKPTELRQISGHLQQIEDTLSDPRARKIRRAAAIHGDDLPDEY